MSPAALILALLGALSVQAQLRTAPARAPSLAPTLSAPLAPAPLTPLLTPSPTVALPLAAPQPHLTTPTLPRAAATARPAHAAAVPASPALQAPSALQSLQALPLPHAGEGEERVSVHKSLTQAVQTLSRSGEAAQAPALSALFAAERPLAVNAAAVLGNEGAGRAPQRLLPAGQPAAPRAGPAPAAQPPLDADGRRMSAALRELAGRSAPEPLVVDFRPSPASLKEMAKLDREVFLYRDRDSGVWRLAGGDRWSVSGDFGDYDLGLHNHPDIRLGVYSLYSPYPSPDDFLNASGKEARVFVVSVQGVAEWNTITPMLDEPGKFLEADASDADARTWLARLESGSWARRLVMRMSFPTGWPTLARSLGLAMELRPWRKVTQEWLDSGKPPETAATLARSLTPRRAGR